MANFGDILTSINLASHQSVRRNLDDTAFEAYNTDQESVTVRVRSTDYPTGLSKGTVVYIGGAVGNRPYVLKADADMESTSSKTFGVLVQDIAANGDGLCAISGVVTGLDLKTSDGWADGDFLWLSQTAGLFTKTVPPEPAHAVFIGVITRAHPTLGSMIVAIQNGYELNEIHGVLLDDPPANGDVLTYETSSGLWKNKSASGGGVKLLAAHYSDSTATNTTVDCFSTTLSAGLLSANGHALRFKLAGNAVNTGADTGDVRIFFAGTELTNTADSVTNGSWSVEALIVRESNTIARYSVSYFIEEGAATITTYGRLTTGIDFTTAEIIKAQIVSNGPDVIVSGRVGTLEHLPT